jgi:histone-lysine N-methyltransferase SETMAR
MQQVKPEKNMKMSLSCMTKARLYTSLRTMEATTELHYTVLPHPPYSPDLAPSIFHPFRQVRSAIHSRKFQDDDKINVKMKTWLRQTPENFY